MIKLCSANVLSYLLIMASTSDLKLNIISMNVRGIRNTKKRRSLFSYFKNNKFDIISLQETHLTNKDTNIIEAEWGPNFHISEGTLHSKGMLTLFGFSIKSDDIRLGFKDNRCLVSLISIDDVDVAIAHFYGPCNYKEKHIFLKNFQAHINKIINDFSFQNIVALGDFNIVKNNNLDIISGLPHTNDIVQVFNDKISELLLFDV